jgi:hypothetical protein
MTKMENPENQFSHTRNTAANPKKRSIFIFAHKLPQKCVEKCVEKCVNRKMTLFLKLDHFYKDLYEGNMFLMHYISVL